MPLLKFAAVLSLVFLLVACERSATQNLAPPLTAAQLALLAAPATTSADVELLSGIATRGGTAAGIVTLKDVPTGRQLGTHTDNGRYDFDVSGLAGPFLLRMVADDDGEQLYALAFRRPGNTVGNLSPVSTRALAALLASLPTPSTAPAVFQEPLALAALDKAVANAAVFAVLAATTPAFRSALASAGIDSATVNPVSASLEAAVRLDTALRAVRLRQDLVQAECWEESSTGVVGGGGRTDTLGMSADYIAIDGWQNGMLAGTRQQFSAYVYWSGVPFNRYAWSYLTALATHGVTWSVSNPELASISADGLLTVGEVNAAEYVQVRATYRVGDNEIYDEREIQLLPHAAVTGVSLDGIPDVIDAPARLELFTLLTIDSPLSATMREYDGNWEIVAPDPYSQTFIRLENEGSAVVLDVGALPADVPLTLRATQQIFGEEFVTEKTVRVRRFVMAPVTFELRCPAQLQYDVPATCPATVSWSDGSTSEVDPTLSVADTDSAKVTISGNTLTSRWGDTRDPARVRVTATFGKLVSSQAILLNARDTRLVSLEIQGITEIQEGGSATFRVLGHRSDGNVEDVPVASWQVSDPSLGVVDYYHRLQAGYILIGDQDRVLTLTASVCPVYQTCADEERISAQIPVVVRYRPARLRGIRLAVDNGVGPFVKAGSVTPMAVTAVWDKRTPAGDWATSAATGPVTWQTSDPVLTVVDNQLHAGSFGEEMLFAVTASVADPRDPDVVRTGSLVLTAHEDSGQPTALVNSFLLRDGLVHGLSYAGYGSLSSHTLSLLPFMSDAREVLGGGGVYLRQNGTVWTNVAVDKVELPDLLRDALRSSGVTSIPRRIPGLAGIVDITGVGFTPNNGGCHCYLAALRGDGTVWGVTQKTDDAGRISFPLNRLGTVSNGRALASNWNLLLTLLDNGTVFPIGLSGPLKSGVHRADGSLLSGITSLAVTTRSVLALRSNGTVWGWGVDGYVEPGVAGSDYATRIAGVDESLSISYGGTYGTTAYAVRASDGAVISWGDTGTDAPHRVGTLAGVAYMAGDFAVGANGDVWYLRSPYGPAEWLQVTAADAAGVPTTLNLR